jgi:hypothetical protein
MTKAARATILLLAVLLGMTVIDRGAVHAQQVVYTFTDPVGDQTGPVDVTNLVVIFDFQGNYTIYITADPAHPLFGKFRVNINLYNPDIDPQFAFFSHNCTKKCDGFGGNTDFDITTPRTTLRITGHSDVLKHWPSGTRAVTSSFAGLGPPGSLYRSAVNGFPLTFGTNEDCMDCNGFAVGQLQFSRRGWVLPTPAPTP